MKGEYEAKLAQKEGEIIRFERALSETKSMLSDKTYQVQKVNSNLQSELQSLSERCQSLEKERADLLELNAQIETTLKQALGSEKSKLTEKLLKQKALNSELRDKLGLSEGKLRDLDKKFVVVQKENESLSNKVEDLVR